jgi:hypothetical protein
MVFLTVPPGGPQRKREEILWFSYSTPGPPQRKRDEIQWFFYSTPQGAFSENVRKSYCVLTVPQGGPQRKREEILWSSYSPPRGPSAKT